jgi:hypothetical protein
MHVDAAKSVLVNCDFRFMNAAGDIERVKTTNPTKC